MDGFYGLLSRGVFFFGGKRGGTQPGGQTGNQDDQPFEREKHFGV